jgi:hypothetical protein
MSVDSPRSGAARGAYFTTEGAVAGTDMGSGEKMIVLGLAGLGHVMRIDLYEIRR